MKKRLILGWVVMGILMFSTTDAQSNPPFNEIPAQREVLSSHNVNDAKPLAVWGTGSIFDVDWMDETHIAFASESGTWVYELGSVPTPAYQTSQLDQQVFAFQNSDWIVTYSVPDINLFSSSLTAWNTNGESQTLLKVTHILGADESPVMQVFDATDQYIVASQGAVVYVWPNDFSSAPLRFEQPATNRTGYVVEQADLSEDGNYLAMAARAILSDQLIISIWDTHTGEQRILYQDDYLPLERLILRELQFNENGTELDARLGFTTVWRWDLTSGKSLDPIELYCDDDPAKWNSTPLIPYINFQMGLFLCADSFPNGTGHLQLRSINTREVRTAFDVNRYFRPVYTFSPDGHYMAMGDADESQQGNRFSSYRVVVWDIENDELYAEFQTLGDSAQTLEFSPSGKQLLAGNADGNFQIWDMDSKAQAYFVEPGHALPVTSLSFSPDGHWLVSAATNPYTQSNYFGMSRGFVARWDLRTGEYDKLVDGADSQVTSAIFSPDGKVLYMGDLDGKLVIWDAQTFKPLQTLVSSIPIYSMSINADGTLLAIVSDHQLSIFDTHTATFVNRLQHRRSGAGCRSQFSPDGAWLRLCDALWKVEQQGRLIASWEPEKLSETLKEWYRVASNSISFLDDSERAEPVFWYPSIWSSLTSNSPIIMNSAHDLIAMGSPDGVIALYGIEKEGS